MISHIDTLKTEKLIAKSGQTWEEIKAGKR